MDLAEAADALRALHVPGRPLVLPNAWDATSARLVEQAGFPVVATSSAALVAALGYEDGGTAPPDEVFAAVGRISRAVPVPVTADVEDGYGLDAGELVDALLGAGAVGCNLEDRGVTAEAHAERVAAVKAAGRARGVDLVVNARVDSFLQGAGIDDAIARGRAYRAAGADCVFPIFADDVGRFVAEVGGCVNAIARVDDPQLDRLAELGVARISFGPGLARAANALLQDLLSHLRKGN
jgi:2-methylisocitrate lyase-like PEP mutase family enzyme